MQLRSNFWGILMVYTQPNINNLRLNLELLKSFDLICTQT
jgi:hypothetical protein